MLSHWVWRVGWLSAIDNCYRNKTQTCRHPVKWQMVSLLWCSKVCRWFIKPSSHDLFIYSIPIWSQSCFLLNVILNEPHSKDKWYHLKILAPLLTWKRTSAATAGGQLCWLPLPSRSLAGTFLWQNQNCIWTLAKSKTRNFRLPAPTPQGREWKEVVMDTQHHETVF